MLKVYSVKDVKGAFAAPFLALNDALAARNIKGFLKTQKGHEWSLYPEDFELWLLGEFDEQTGIITPVKLDCVARLIALVDHENVD